MSDPAGIVLDRLAALEHDSGRTLGDPELNESLGPFRSRLPIRVYCPRRGCHGTLCYLGLPAKGPSGYVAGPRPVQVEGGRAVWAPNAPNMPRQWKDPIPEDQLRPQPPFPYDVWSIGSAWDGCRPSPLTDPSAIALHERWHVRAGQGCPPGPTWCSADPSGRWLRITFTCGNCGASYTLTNETMLKKVVLAVSRNLKEIPAT